MKNLLFIIVGIISTSLFYQFIEIDNSHTPKTEVEAHVANKVPMEKIFPRNYDTFKENNVSKRSIN